MQKYGVHRGQSAFDHHAYVLVLLCRLEGAAHGKGSTMSLPHNPGPLDFNEGVRCAVILPMVDYFSTFSARQHFNSETAQFSMSPVEIDDRSTRLVF